VAALLPGSWLYVSAHFFWPSMFSPVDERNRT
jgi:hypothetical protein